MRLKSSLVETGDGAGRAGRPCSLKHAAWREKKNRYASGSDLVLGREDRMMSHARSDRQSERGKRCKSNAEAGIRLLTGAEPKMGRGVGNGQQLEAVCARV